MIAATAASLSACHRRQLLSLQPRCKDDLNVSNKIRALFSAFVDTDPLFSTPSKLFSTKQGVRGKHASKICCTEKRTGFNAPDQQLC
jgi:hypothetical protein